MLFKMCLIEDGDDGESEDEAEEADQDYLFEYVN